MDSRNNKYSFKTIRLEVWYNRDEQIIKKIINSHIETGNNIISDGLAAYS